MNFFALAQSTMYSGKNAVRGFLSSSLPIIDFISAKFLFNLISC